MKKSLKKINKSHVVVIMIMLLSALLMLYLTYIKEGMHVDEYLTYGLANYEGDGTWHFSPEYGVRLSAAEVYDDYFYADRLNIKNVWLNQSYNVHPPLYYLLFHIFTLVTHHFLALKTGVLLNIIFHMINIGLIWMILKEMLSKEYEAFLGTVLYGFLPIILGSVLFVRMYVLLSTFILCLTLLFVKEWDGTDKKKFYIKLGLLSVCGTMTHYYFLIYLFFCCMIWGIRILKKKGWKELAVFLVTMTTSGIACLAIFFPMLQHVFSGSAGTRTFDTLFSTVFFKNGKSFYKAIDHVYGGLLLAVIIIVALLLVFQYIYVDKDGNKKKNDGERWIIVALPCILFLLTVTKIAIYSATRYISPVYGICIILLIGLFDRIASYMTDKDRVKCIVGMVMVGFLLNNGWKTYEWPDLYLDIKDCVAEAREYGVNNECIYVVTAAWRNFPCYQEFLQYQNITFIQARYLEQLYKEDYTGYDHVVVYFDQNMEQEEIDEVLQKMIERNPGLDGYEELHMYSYNIAYYLD